MNLVKVEKNSSSSSSRTRFRKLYNVFGVYCNALEAMGLVVNLQHRMISPAWHVKYAAICQLMYGITYTRKFKITFRPTKLDINKKMAKNFMLKGKVIDLIMIGFLRRQLLGVER